MVPKETGSCRKSDECFNEVASACCNAEIRDCRLNDGQC
jgi:hypothetical protein